MKYSAKTTPVELNQIRVWIRGTSSNPRRPSDNPFIIVGFIILDKMPYVKVRYLKNCEIRNVYKTDVIINSCLFDFEDENQQKISLDTENQLGYTVSNG